MSNSLIPIHENRDTYRFRVGFSIAKPLPGYLYHHYSEMVLGHQRQDWQFIDKARLRISWTKTSTAGWW